MFSPLSLSLFAFFPCVGSGGEKRETDRRERERRENRRIIWVWVEETMGGSEITLYIQRFLQKEKEHEGMGIGEEEKIRGKSRNHTLWVQWLEV